MLLFEIEQRLFRFCEGKAFLDHRLDLMFVHEIQHVAEVLRIADLAAVQVGAALLAAVA